MFAIPYWLSPVGYSLLDLARLLFDKGEVTVTLAIDINGTALTDGGDSQAWRGTRLQWLDSDLAQAGDTVPPPYESLSVRNASSAGFLVTMLDKALQIGPDGLPWAFIVFQSAS